MILDNTVKKSAWANIIKGANNMDWKKVIKKSSAMAQLDNIFSKPFDADMHKVITRWLIQMQRDFPNIFKRNVFYRLYVTNARRNNYIFQ